MKITGWMVGFCICIGLLLAFLVIDLLLGYIIEGIFDAFLLVINSVALYHEIRKNIRKS